jgi:hypothetical protein
MMVDGTEELCGEFDALLKLDPQPTIARPGPATRSEAHDGRCKAKVVGIGS